MHIMADTIRLVPYTDDSCEFVYGVKKEAYKKYVEECWGAWIEEVQREYFEKFIADVRNNAFIIMDGENKIGFYNGKELDNGSYEIGNICIVPEFRCRGIGSKILKEKLEENKDRDIELQVFKQNPVGKLYKRLGFVPNGETEFHYKMIKRKQMRVAFTMEYKYPVDERSSVELIPYSKEYQDKYKRIYNECYHEMREQLNIEPYDFIQDDTFFSTGMDLVYLLLENDEIIGSVAIKGEEIDDLIVNPKFQGKGYGKQLLLWALEHVNAERVILHVAEWNKRAVKLYTKNGFEIIETIPI